MSEAKTETRIELSRQRQEAKCGMVCAMQERLARHEDAIQAWSGMTALQQHNTAKLDDFDSTGLSKGLRILPYRLLCEILFSCFLGARRGSQPACMPLMASD